MPWKKVKQNETPVWDFEAEKTLEGELVEKKAEVGANKSNIYIFKVGEEKYAVWGSTVLDDQLAAIEPGMKAQITYLGLKKSKNAGRAAYKDFEVQVWVDLLD